jgi:murein DD-endopeptidase MepM/ murein hydrolase activator NlpD
MAAAGCASQGTPVVHEVKPGENLYRISTYYGVSVARILEENGLDDPSVLETGDQLAIPGAKRPAARDALLPKSGTRDDTPLVRPKSQFTGLGDLRPNALSRYQAVREARKAGLDFRWPLAGKITSGYGRRGLRRHKGIDLRGSPGSPVLAAEAGRVIHSGWLGAYGNAVVISHAGGFATVYAHAVVVGVVREEAVVKGQVIALVGSTGRSTGPHLHFEIRRGDTARNPLLYLPAEP